MGSGLPIWLPLPFSTLGGLGCRRLSPDMQRLQDFPLHAFPFANRQKDDLTEASGLTSVSCNTSPPSGCQMHQEVIESAAARSVARPIVLTLLRDSYAVILISPSM